MANRLWKPVLAYSKGENTVLYNSFKYNKTDDIVKL